LVLFLFLFFEVPLPLGPFRYGYLKELWIAFFFSPKKSYRTSHSFILSLLHFCFLGIAFSSRVRVPSFLQNGPPSPESSFLCFFLFSYKKGETSQNGHFLPFFLLRKRCSTILLAGICPTSAKIIIVAFLRARRNYFFPLFFGASSFLLN